MSDVKNVSDLGLAIKRAMVLDLKQCRWSREQVAQELAAIIGRHITVAQIDAWTAETHIHRLPAECVAAWVRLTGSRRVLELICGESGLWLGDPTDRELAEYGRARLRAEKLAAQTEEMRSQLWGQV